MRDINKELKETITYIGKSFDDELFSKKKEELEEHWFFKYNREISNHANMYEFYKMLKLYSHFCERWEAKHNGRTCIVERVRDNYLMPKIKEFCKHLINGDGV